VQVKFLKEFLADTQARHNGFPVLVPRATKLLQAKQRELTLSKVGMARHTPLFEQVTEKLSTTLTPLFKPGATTRPPQGDGRFEKLDEESGADNISNLTVHRRKAPGVKPTSAEPDNDSSPEGDVKTAGAAAAMDADEELVFGGLILRSQLRVLLRHPRAFISHDIFTDTGETARPAPWVIPFEDFIKVEEDLNFSKYMKDFPLSEAELNMYIDLSPYLNPSAITINDDTILWIFYTMFQSLMLRHMIVLNANGTVCGIITRHDLEPHNISDRVLARRGVVGTQAHALLS
jgi:hypothetical protein